MSSQISASFAHPMEMHGFVCGIDGSHKLLERVCEHEVLAAAVVSLCKCSIPLAGAGVPDRPTDG